MTAPLKQTHRLRRLFIIGYLGCSLCSIVAMMDKCQTVRENKIQPKETEPEKDIGKDTGMKGTQGLNTSKTPAPSLTFQRLSQDQNAWRNQDAFSPCCFVQVPRKARRLYSYLPSCISKLYNLLPQPGNVQSQWLESYCVLGFAISSQSYKGSFMLLPTWATHKKQHIRGAEQAERQRKHHRDPGLRLLYGRYWGLVPLKLYSERNYSSITYWLF